MAEIKKLLEQGLDWGAKRSSRFSQVGSSLKDNGPLLEILTIGLMDPMQMCCFDLLTLLDSEKEINE